MHRAQRHQQQRDCARGGRSCAGQPAARRPLLTGRSLAASRATGGLASATLPPARASSDGQPQHGSWEGVLPESAAALSSSSSNGAPQHQHQQQQHQQQQQQQPRGHWAHGHPDDSWDFVEEDLSCVPPPCNTPVVEDDNLLLGNDVDELLVFPPRGSLSGGGTAGLGAHGGFYHSSGLRSARWMVTDRPGVDMRTLKAEVLAGMGQVYVILFGVGEHDTEGIYSLRAFADDGLPQETIIVFESEEDANRYAGLLEATMDHVPSVCSIPPAELLEFCVDAGYQCRLEPAGSLLIPPDFNVGVTDWERATRLRQGMFAVLDSEPDSQQGGARPSSHTTAPDATRPHAPHHPLSSVSPARPGGNSSSSMAKYHPSFKEDELADIRNMLESLLPLTSTTHAMPAGGADAGQLSSHAAPDGMAAPQPGAGPLGGSDPDHLQ